MTAFEECKKCYDNNQAYHLVIIEDHKPEEIMELIQRGIVLERDKNGIDDWCQNSPYIRCSWKGVDVKWD